MNYEITTRADAFEQRFSSTARGARLARLLAVEHLTYWGWPPDHPLVEAVALVVGELAANAVAHAGAWAEDFEIRLTRDTPSAAVRLEVTDTAGDFERVHVRCPAATAESGRGLLIVDAIADAWGVEPHAGGGKTVWAELSSSAVAVRPP
ncbi:ATP-binding protein [Yinghuangia seranimata]|uniref:ATP-binding protein n=1 Tax=Yinghuangia seranimata TaxID=408067 RepID=UPI00248AB08E|nr:ATP-binding protein [Yinghuangia seranimata]MDI2125097.1 ATP-binding protein [Yinghuangia seranimata]